MFVLCLLYVNFLHFHFFFLLFIVHSFFSLVVNVLFFFIYSCFLISFWRCDFFPQFSCVLSLNCCLIHVFACKYKYEIMKIKHFDCFFHSIFIRALSLSLFHSLFSVTFVFSIDFFVVVVVIFKFNLSLKSFAYAIVWM